VCTVTVWHRRDGLLLAMNRDERRDRAPESPPEFRGAGGHWLAPSDGKAGGTWFATCARGFAGCILNRYQDSTHGGAPPAASRGLILAQLCESPFSPDRMLDAADFLRPTEFAPFTLVLS